MLGIEDRGVALAFLLCLAGTLLCLVYGWLNWNKGDEKIQQEDIQWASEEDKVEDKL